MEATKVGVLVTVLIFVAGLGMFVLEGQYSGALIISGDRQCEETENLYTYSYGDQKHTQSIFKKGGTKTKVGTAPWSQVIPETCSNGVLTERYCGLFNVDGTYKLDATSESLTCVNGCASGGMTGGKCKFPVCSDSDNGQNYQITGTTTGLMLTDPQALGVPPYTQNAKTYTDTCFGNTTGEYSCYSAGQGNYEIRMTNYSCSSLGTGYACQNGRCVSTIEICDGIDNDNDGQMDEGCDDDNDDYCDKTMTRATSYSCSGSNNCCPSGGGDCADGYPGDNQNHLNDIALYNPGAQEDCFKGGDENCNGQYGEGCSPFVCSDDENSVVYSSASGQGGPSYSSFAFCNSTIQIDEYYCPTTPIQYLWLIPYSSATSCAGGTTCNDPDGSNGPTSAVCS